MAAVFSFHSQMQTLGILHNEYFQHKELMSEKDMEQL